MNYKFLKYILIVKIYLLPFSLTAQDFMMQGWYWDYPKTINGHKWTDTLRLKAPELAQVGINQIWIPPHVKASFGQGSNGYDPRDLYDLGQHGATGLGTRTDFDNMVATFQQHGITTVGDMVYNHRDGGAPENNPAAEGWIKNFNDANGNHPFPSDRVRAVLSIGGNTGRGAGEYYIAFRSATADPVFNSRPYRIYTFTDRVGWQNLSDLNEQEPNNGFGQFNNLTLGRNMNATIDGAGGVDEFKITLTANDFNAAGDHLYIIFANQNGDYSDHFVWNGELNGLGERVGGLWYVPEGANNGTQLMPELRYQTYTDFTNMPSGMGAMNWQNFKPNGNPTNLGGRVPGDFGWDHMIFFFDYDQFNPDTRDKLIDWTKWNWNNAGIRGLRVDAIKHFTPQFMSDLLNALNDEAMNPPMVVGEWYDSNPGPLINWVNQVKAGLNTPTRENINVRIFDFHLRDHLMRACDAFGYDVRNIYDNNLRARGLSGFEIVTFANNHDFRRSRNEPIDGLQTLIRNNPELAYAFILTNNQLGIPCIYYPDYYGYRPADFDYHPENLTPLKDEINQLILAHKAFIFGANSVDYLNRFSTPYSANFISGFSNTSLIYQLSGAQAGREVVVAINFAGETLRVDHQIRNIAQGTTFTDVFGRSAFPNAVVDNQNRIYIELPPRSYSIWVQGEVAPLQPTNLRLTALTQGSASLAWTDNAGNEANFLVERKTGNAGTWATLATLSANETSFTDATIENNTTYFYRVRASNTQGNSNPSNEQEARFNFDPTTSLENTFSKKVQVFPNPNEGRFIIKIESFSGQGEYGIYNAQGKQLLKGVLQHHTQEINLSHLPQGVYLLNVWLNGQKHTQRIVID